MIRLCQLSEVPAGEMRCMVHEDRRFLVAHTSEGVFASDEMCTHEDASLCDGNLTGRLVKCPLHGSRFDLSNGAVLDEPADIDLKVYPVKLIDDDVYIDA